VTAGNLLYYGDNLDVLRRHIADESVDLVYLDPPFKSNQDYNVLFADHGVESAAQIRAFEDTWRWDEAAAAAYDEVVTGGGGRVADALVAFRRFLGDNDVLAYLSMMAPRLVELGRVLKPTVSIYLHCDPAASHYLKMLMDSVFGPSMFRNEIIWKRTHAHSGARRYGPVHDTLLYYSKGPIYTWNPQHAKYSADYIASKFRFTDDDGRRYRETILTGSGIRNGSSGRPWRGVDPTTAGRHWAVPGYVRTLLGDGPFPDVQAALDRLDEIGRVKWPAKGAVPVFKQYIDDLPGTVTQDIWTDIDPLDSRAGERLGYPTQKPTTLLERIIQASSDEGNTVLDPFCGCGTTVAAAQRLHRRWIGIDITHLAIGLIKTRLTDTHPEAEYKVVGEPTTVEDAAQLAGEDPFQFQAWALGLVGARIAGSDKKGPDKGVDGRLYFNEGSGSTKQIIISVKAGKLKSDYVRALGGLLTTFDAQIGVLISFEAPTKPMRADAASAGFYESPWGKHPRIQLLTVGELLEGARIDYPQTTGSNVTYKKAQAAKVSAGDQLPLVAEAAPDEPYADDSDDVPF